jgi:peptidoglycan/xylan/chitin deacetylase (PgdA/CDA1 family)
VRGIPALMYHHVNPAGSSINVTPGNFDRQMRFLKENGYQTLHTGEFLDVINGQRQIPKKAVIITFDDGWLDNWIYAFPILKKYGLKAVVFVITSLIADKGKRQRTDEGTPSGLPSHKECRKMIEAGLASEVMLSWEELREMENSGLVDVQSHTHAHIRWDKLFNDHKMKLDALNQDLKLSKETIEKRLDKKCNALCWPWGMYNKDYIGLARSSGYELLFTTEKGTNTPLTEQWRIRRLVIGNISTLTLRKKLFIHSRDWLSKAYLKIFK